VSQRDAGGASRLILSSTDDVDDVFRHIDLRLTEVERGLARLETDRAISEERRKFMEERFNQLDTRLDRIDGHITRLVWLIIAAILGGFMSFVLRGALVSA
jgi:hypothetical protein